MKKIKEQLEPRKEPKKIMECIDLDLPTRIKINLICENKKYTLKTIYL